MSEKIGGITAYEDEDGKAVFEFDGKITSTEKLLTTAQDVIGAINELFLLEPGGGDEDWSPPEYWIDIPEPEANQVVMLIEVTESYINVPLCSISAYGKSDDGKTTYPSCTIDWGNGYKGEKRENYGEYVAGIYTEPGMYIVTVTITGNDNNKEIALEEFTITRACYKGEMVDVRSQSVVHVIRAIKFGKNIGLYYPLHDGGYRYFLVYAKFLGDYGWLGTNMYALKKLEIAGNFNARSETAYPRDYYSLESISIHGITELPAQFCNNCFSLKKADFPDVISAGTYVFSQCYALKSVNLPKLTAVSSGMFSKCCSLKNINLPSATAIEDSAFSGCYSLETVDAPNASNINYAAFGKETVRCFSLKEVNASCDFDFGNFPQINKL